MAINKKVLVIDCGTQSMRAHIVDSEGNVLSTTRAEYPPHIAENPEWVEWRAEDFWQAAAEVILAQKQRMPEQFQQIEALTVTSQRVSTVFVDKQGKPVRNMISWMDGRLADKNRPMGVLYNLLGGLAGHTHTFKKLSRLCQAHWLMENEPENWLKTHKVLLLGSYLNYKFTGEYKDSVASAVGYLPLDAKQQAWAKDGSLLKSLFQIDDSRLFDLVKPGDKIGELSSAAAAITGLKTGLPVIASASDKACESIGMGSINENVAAVSLGSNSTFSITSARSLSVPLPNGPFPSALASKHNYEVGIAKGFWLVSWFEHEFGHREQLEAERLNVATLELFNERIKDIPPGSLGLIVQPHWGANTNHPDSKGSIIGFNGYHTRYHMYRALIEGLGFSLRQGMETIEAKLKDPIEEIVVSGGASQSDTICQILADIFGRSVHRVQTCETSGLGGAIVAFVGLGVYESVESAVSAMVHRTDQFKPKTDEKHSYTEIYSKVYVKKYQRLKPLYKQMNKLGISSE